MKIEQTKVAEDTLSMLKDDLAGRLRTFATTSYAASLEFIPRFVVDGFPEFLY